MTFPHLKDQAYEAFGLDKDKGISAHELTATCYDNLRFHTQGNQQAFAEIMQIVSDVDAIKIAHQQEGQAYCQKIGDDLAKVRTTDEAKSAAVAVIAAEQNVLHQVMREFPSPTHHHIFANHEEWRHSLKAVGQVLRNNASAHLPHSPVAFVMPAPASTQ